MKRREKKKEKKKKGKTTVSIIIIVIFFFIILDKNKSLKVPARAEITFKMRNMGHTSKFWLFKPHQ